MFPSANGYHATRWLTQELHLPECTTPTAANASEFLILGRIQGGEQRFVFDGTFSFAS